jgi:hypothetical protein
MTSLSTGAWLCVAAIATAACNQPTDTSGGVDGGTVQGNTATSAASPQDGSSEALVERAADVENPAALPGTASPVPLAGFFGVAALGAAWSIA